MVSPGAIAVTRSAVIAPSWTAGAITVVVGATSGHQPRFLASL